ncbi:MAG: phosphoglucomutase/phosphomannomutase family protein [Endomicrobium sp.]|jgi:alpha-D-glucose phosphate-specific phosphoglucomutase|nr:phosphoglucomutase/phosphomannomutase family protein [Endomicrobium sp.]
MIRFGTSGWRGIIAKDFTYANVSVVTQAIANLIREEHARIPISVIVGYDTRFMSEDFAKTAAEILAGNNIKALLCKKDTPTPVIAYDIVFSKLAGGINFTASHNSYKYNGLKYFSSYGGTALPITTQKIEKYCAVIRNKDIKSIPFEYGIKKKLIKMYDPNAAYIKKMKELINFQALKKSKIKVAIDVLHGVGNGYLNTLFNEVGISNITINKNRDTMFEGNAPDPSEKNLIKLANIVKHKPYKLGLSVDGDADRFGIIDFDGTFITPNQVIPVLLHHLNKTRGWTGITAKSIMTTHLVNKLADKINVDVIETPVGFKYICDVMVNNPDKFIIGGEESGGLTIRGHIPEKDGILACLLMTEAIVMSKKSVADLLKDVKKLTGEILTSRVDFSLPEEVINSFTNTLKNRLPNNFAGIRIQKNITTDGYKFILDDNTWIGFRFAGTEPVVRVYAEANSCTKLHKILKAGKAFIYGK